MQVLKVEAEGPTTSFRYPHFMQQVHPTFEMPPPSTIYGHICSALGEWVDPAGVQFAYQFRYQGAVTDVEHIIVLSAATGSLPGTKIPKVLEGNVNPFDRHLLFKPHLTLYVNRPEWRDAFRSPRYAVVLGRSQDLFTYTSVEVLELEQADRAYFENTLLPHDMVMQTMRGVTVLMPRFLDYERNRFPTFDNFLVLKDRVHLPGDAELQFSHIDYGPYWIDPTSAEINGDHLGLAFHHFVGESDDALGVA
ncbi:MAG: type I-B CRISPR-associated protein Cas5 [Anaerolineales bacterium]|nr:type I-B CRISPR-associated protein Cas5 [Anaerolineales bacterium]